MCKIKEYVQECAKISGITGKSSRNALKYL